MAARRSYGTGSLYVRVDAAGREAWYGKWRQNGRQVKRALGLKRAAGSREGLTRSQAETELRTQIGQVSAKAAPGEVLTVEEVSTRYLTHAERRGRKLST